MKHIILLSVFAVSTVFPVSGQQVRSIDTATAVLKVVVKDTKNNPRKGEQVTITGTKNQKIYKGISNESGEVCLRVLGAQTYDVLVKTIGRQEQKSKVLIPPLYPGERYSGEMVLTVRYEPASVFTLSNVYFEPGKAVIKKESTKELDELVEFLKLKPELNIEIAGHTDNTGEEEANLKLSQSRAEAVRAWLISKGVKAAQVTAKGYGGNDPVTENITEEGRQKNCRTDVKILEG